jgi:hypothetical protein
MKPGKKKNSRRQSFVSRSTWYSERMFLGNWSSCCCCAISAYHSKMIVYSSPRYFVSFSHSPPLRVSTTTNTRPMASETTFDARGSLDIGPAVAEVGVLI